MKKIFIPTPLDEIIELPKDVTHHVLHVFRHNMEKPITVTGSDNRCGIYQITDEVDGIAQAKLIEYVATDVSSYRTILVQSLLKGEKLEWVLQKAMELNVDTIYLVSTANCVAKYDDKKLQSKVSRWEKIMLEAAQQCGRNQLPTLVVGETLSQVLAIEADALKLVAYENEDGHTIKSALQSVHTNQTITDILICVGPEGGYQEKEINAIIESGGKSVSLGNTILRAETAAIGSLAMIQYELEL
ncbi:RsmE family RNA methyltransferase [Veillonella infantium]|uniref:Ribosomal RNA small subunit methyltransferase E n=1 Tax=Veillonella infantium TaxID=1911679 RepID=A0ABX5C5F8_9FIRM|nr:RsmE family RNA methyltransferase [Veillonella infantium]PQL57842.1 RNA methyltransferase [Veillonella infantium]